MRLIIIRHAEPDYENNTITKQGFLEASALADRLLKEKIDYVYLSPLGRAQDTAKEYLLRSKKEAITFEWLKEFSYSYNDQGIYKKNIPWDFKIEQVANFEGFYDNSRYMNNDIFKGTEVEKQYNYVVKQFDNLLEQHGYKRNDCYYEVTNSNKDTIVIVCHLGLECVLLSRLFNLPFAAIAQHFGPVPSAISIIYTEERAQGLAQFRAQVLGDYTHLIEHNIEPSFMGRFRENAFDDTRSD